MPIIQGGKVIEGVGDRAELNSFLANAPQVAIANQPATAAADVVDVANAGPADVVRRAYADAQTAKINAILAALRAVGIVTP